MKPGPRVPKAPRDPETAMNEACSIGAPRVRARDRSRAFDTSTQGPNNRKSP